MTTQMIDTRACLSADMELTLKAIVVFPVHGEPGPEDHWIQGWDTTCAALRDGKEPYCWHAITFAIHGGAEAHQERIRRGLAVQTEWLENVTSFLLGEVADCLYTALAGRALGETPDDADMGRALTARAAIADLAAEGVDGYVEARAAVEAFGPFIEPWLATTKLDEEGRIITDDPYYDRIPLTLSAE